MPEEVIIFIRQAQVDNIFCVSFAHFLAFSCGFDACEHEYPSMSRHNRRVPTSFYYHFAKDAQALADKYANGKLVSVLEGGYSDRALISGAMAHLCGLSYTDQGINVDEKWWNVDNLSVVRSIFGAWSER